jgi:hypothetical protein
MPRDPSVLLAPKSERTIFTFNLRAINPKLVPESHTNLL